MRPTKKELLEHYSSGEVIQYAQLDGWANHEPGDSFMIPDIDGDVLSGTIPQYELRHMKNEVRVFIREGTAYEDAVRILNKLANWLEKDPDFLIIENCSNCKHIAMESKADGAHFYCIKDDSKPGPELLLGNICEIWEAKK